MLYGSQGVLYYLTTGTRATWNATVTAGFHVGSAPASLSAITGVKDVTTDDTAPEIDASTRDQPNDAQTAVGMKKKKVGFKIRWNPGDASHQALMLAYDTRANIACAVLEGIKTLVGVTGLWADFAVTKFAKSEPMEGVIEIDVELTPGVSAVAPERVQVA